MKILRTVNELRRELASLTDLGFVPTMGALHAGHASLLRQARKDCSTVVLSIFVNPTQFGPNEDLARYPRQEEQDLKLADMEGTDVVFIPSVSEIYTSETAVVRVDGPSALWEGAARPGHFEGVATVVAKLFHIVGPCRAYFGLKDLQQCAVIRAMAAALFFPIELRFCETVREPSGLAMSSRNAYMTATDKESASQIYHSLKIAAQSLSLGDTRKEIDLCLHNAKDLLESTNMSIDYLDVVDSTTMLPSQRIEAGHRIIVAVRFAGVRLIDNVLIQ
ncbi:MAG: pantoate--beta-alanine ligase [Armatimonadetes bacterium]|nr:pantoate--beta-alanine ligase [Armatimonadota bacterium]